MSDTVSCDIYWATATGLRYDDPDVLDAAERNRLATIQRKVDRDLFTTGVTLLKQRLASAVRCDPREITIDRRCDRCGGPHGRPTVPDLGFFVSVTHSNALVGIALTRAGQVGLDVEFKDRPHLRSIERHVIAPTEATVRRSTDLLCYWTRKEALVKATGDGIGIGMTNLQVSAPGDAPRLLHYPGRCKMEVQMADLSGRPGYVASAAVITSGSIHFREIQSDLLARSPDP